MYSEEEKKEFASIKKKENTYFTFFTSGLLYWVIHSANIIKDQCNRFFIAAGLQENEVEFIKAHITHPVFFIKEYCTDQDIWNLLFTTCENNFGWIDIDCFVGNKDVFTRMSIIDSKTIFNCYWTSSNRLCTYFIYVNINAVKDMSRRKIPITPYAYSNYKEKSSYYTKAITKDILPYIKQVLPNPNTVSENSIEQINLFFDTLILYQLAAEQIGYHITDIGEKYFPNTLYAFHIGGCVYYSYQDIVKGSNSKGLSDEKSSIFKVVDQKELQALKFLLAHYILTMYVDILPVEYTILQKFIVKNQLQENNINREQYKDFILNICQHNANINDILKLLKIEL